MCTRVLWNTNQLAVLTGRSTIWARMSGLDLHNGAPTLAVDPYDESLAGDVTGHFRAHGTGF